MQMIKEIDVERLSRLHHLHHWKFPWFYENIRNQISVEEFKIQQWWTDKISMIDKEVNILSSGLGVYALPFCVEKGASYTRLIDMDPITEEVSNLMNSAYGYEPWSHFLMDITFDYEHIPDADIYVNTSCEHSYHMKKVIPSGKICVLSGCDLTKRGHINLIKSCDDLIEQADISEVMYTGEMVFPYDDDLGSREYNQYFVIGVK